MVSPSIASVHHQITVNSVDRQRESPAQKCWTANLDSDATAFALWSLWTPTNAKVFRVRLAGISAECVPAVSVFIRFRFFVAALSDERLIDFDELPAAAFGVIDGDEPLQFLRSLSAASRVLNDRINQSQFFSRHVSTPQRLSRRDQGPQPLVLRPQTTSDGVHRGVPVPQIIRPIQIIRRVL